MSERAAGRQVAIHRLNHAVLYVRNVERSAAFYRDVLDFEPIADLSRFRGACFLRAPGSTNDHDLGLFELGEAAEDSGAGRTSVGMYHLAWEVDTLTDLQVIGQRLADAGALVGASDHGTTKSLYAKDPDGLEFEVAWVVPAALIDDEALRNRGPARPLDLRREVERFGADTLGGVGVSRSGPATPTQLPPA